MPTRKPWAKHESLLPFSGAMLVGRLIARRRFKEPSALEPAPL
jgi:hypothetical protein